MTASTGLKGNQGRPRPGHCGYHGNRSGVEPEFPTVSESGGHGYEAAFAFGMVRPTKARGSRQSPESGYVASIEQGGHKEKFMASGDRVVGQLAAGSAGYVRSELASMGTVIKDAAQRE